MAADNKLIAKNTIFLYLRMLATFVVGLYTYQLIINAMGLEDYGIFGVIGDIVGILYMLNGALTIGSSRFMTYALAEGDLPKMRATFITTLTIHVIFAAILLLLGEGIGIWYINHKMVIDAARIDAAQIVLQLTLLSAVINITQVPFTSLIVAHERMSIYAWIAIADALFKLGIAYALTLWGGDRLILYAALILVQGLLTTAFLRIYCAMQFKECVTRLGIDRTLFDQISRFVGWNMLQNIITALNNQGLTMLIASFFSPVIIAARAIAVKILIQATQFIANFRQAMNPQIVKLYAAGERDEYRKMVLNSAKFSYYIFWLIALPIIMNTDSLLLVWLRQIPAYASIFLKLSMIDTLFWLFDASFNQGIVATGDIKRNTLWTCSIDILRFPILYLLLRQGFGPVCVYAVSILSGALIGLYIRPRMLHRQAGFKASDFMPVYGRCLMVSIVSLVVPMACYPFTHQSLQGLSSFLAGSFVALLSAVVTILFVGMDRELRNKVSAFIRRKIQMKLAIMLVLPLAFATSAQAAEGNGTGTEGFKSLTLDLSTEVSAGSGSYNPYYIVSNRHGIASPRPNNGYFRADLEGSLSKGSLFFNAGIDLQASMKAYSPFYIQQLYVEGVWKQTLAIMIGSRETNSLLRDQRLSSGSMVWSGNARPVPQLWGGTKGFITVPYTHQWLQISAGMSYGRYMDTDYQEDEYQKYLEGKTGFGRSWITTDVWSHHKHLLFRTNAEKPWYFTFGIEHAAQFGGHTRNSQDPLLSDADFSPSFADLLHVFMLSSGGSNSAVGDQNFKYGNHIGELTTQIEYQWGANNSQRIGLYGEDPFEDGSGIEKRNGWDGLWGIEYHNSAPDAWIGGIVLEYLQTTHQSGPIHWAPGDFNGQEVSSAMPQEATGQDDYYNNYFYTGYSHYGFACGSPMLKSPAFNQDHYLRFTDNRVRAWHLGIEGSLPLNQEKIGYRILASHRRSWGTYYYPNPEILESTNAMLELNYQHRQWTMTAGYAFDHGGLYGNNQAFTLRFNYHLDLRH